ncbi:MAG: hypothetical protein VKP57_02750 [Candidatus Sericytochromatia bacterium]|nr:hypothetical protein [Candidatus Sericytochromatia bacterium]
MRRMALVALAVVGCGGPVVSLPRTTAPVDPVSAGSTSALSQAAAKAGVWQATTATGTGNVVSVVVEAARKTGVGPRIHWLPGTLRLTYRDTTGYFAGRTTLNGLCVLVMPGGRKVEVGSVSLGRSLAGTTVPEVFTGEGHWPVEAGNEVPVALELAVSSSDRYGHLRWDSNYGRNYRLARD